LHRRLRLRFCCPARRFDLRLASSLPALPSIANRLAPLVLSGSASRSLSGLRLCSTVPPHLPRCSSACAASIASGSAFLLCQWACASRLSLSASPSALSIGLRPRLSFRFCLPAWPLGLRFATGLSALPSYLTAGFPTAFVLWRCPRLRLRLSPWIPSRAHPSDSTSDLPNCRLSGFTGAPAWLSPDLIAPAFPSNFQYS